MSFKFREIMAQVEQDGGERCNEHSPKRPPRCPPPSETPCMSNTKFCGPPPGKYDPGADLALLRQQLQQAFSESPDMR